MVLQQIRIGSAVDVFQYDDADFDSAIEVTAPMKCTAPVDATDVLRLEDLGGGAVADLTALLDNSMADTLHRHSELSASDGAPDACVQVDAAGSLTLVGDARVNKIQVIHLSAMKKGVGSPPGEGLKDGFPTYDFDNVADEEVFFSFTTPDDYDVSTDMSLHAQFFVDTAPVAAAGVAWVIEWKATAAGETIDFTAGTATVLHAHPVTTGTPANDALRLDCNELTGGAGAIAAGDLIQCRLYRDVSDAGDTFAGDARLIGVHVHYIGNKLGEPI